MEVFHPGPDVPYGYTTLHMGCTTLPIGCTMWHIDCTTLHIGCTTWHMALSLHSSAPACNCIIITHKPAGWVAKQNQRKLDKIKKETKSSALTCIIKCRIAINLLSNRFALIMVYKILRACNQISIICIFRIFHIYRIFQKELPKVQVYFSG